MTATSRNHLRPARSTAAAALLLLCSSPPGALLGPVSAEGSLRYSRGAGGGDDDGGQQQGAKRQAPRETRRNEEEDRPSAAVRVFDDVVPSPLARRALMDFAELHGKEKAWKFDDSTSTFFDRSSQSSPLERVLDAILTELGDANEYVEYWSRDEHVNVKAHADIDEGLEEYLWPESSHVLYLGVQQSRIAPTVVFPDRVLGWDGEDLDDAMKGARRKSTSTGGKVEMISVPSVEGRLLKFDGRAMHGVPRPYDRWIAEMLDDGNRDDDDGARRSVPKDYDYDDDLASSSSRSNDEDEDTIEESYQRSVLIFNSWSKLPPNAVLWSDIKHAPPPEAESKLARGSSDATPVRRVNGNGEDLYGSNSGNDDDEDDDDDDFNLIDFGSKDLNAAERWGRARRDGLSLIHRLRGQDNRISEAESTMAAKWAEEFGPGLEGMGATERTKWSEAQIDSSRGSTAPEGNPLISPSDARRRMGLAEMDEAAEEVAGPPPVKPRVDVATKVTDIEGTGGEVLDVELMGSPYRRLHPFDTVRLTTVASSGGMTAREALESAHRPTSLVLQEEKFD